MLHQHEWKPNDIQHFFNHDDILQKLNSLKGNPLLSQKRCTAAFIAGIGGSYPRGLSVLPAWYHLENVLVHNYEEKITHVCCWECGDYDSPEYENDAFSQYRLYSGNAYSSTPSSAYLNLKHIMNMPPVTPTEQDIEVLRNLFQLLRIAPDNETPTKFEKRLKESKLIKGELYVKRGLLHTLALVGVIPNHFIELSPHRWISFGELTNCEEQIKNRGERLNMAMPWAGWVGALKVNEERIVELFGDYL